MTAAAPSSSPRVALVTGAAQGIGHAAAARFLAEGWSVAMLDWKTDVLEAAAAAFRQPERILALPKDVSQPADVAAAVEAVRARFGRLDALVNNAGIAHFGPLMDTPLEAWNEVMAVNLTGPFIMTKAAVPLMRETGGAIVNITSISGVRASTLRVAYGTSKAALAHLTKQMAVELASYGIRVNAVARVRSTRPWRRRCIRRRSAPITTTPSRSTAMASRGARRRHRLSLLARRQLHHRPDARRRWRLRRHRHRPADAPPRPEERLSLRRRSPAGLPAAWPHP